MRSRIIWPGCIIWPTGNDTAGRIKRGLIQPHKSGLLLKDLITFDLYCFRLRGFDIDDIAILLDH